MTVHVSTTILPTVDLPKPKSDASERYSIFVANFHTVTATLSSTVTGDLILVELFVYYPCDLQINLRFASRFIRIECELAKFDFNALFNSHSCRQAFTHFLMDFNQTCISISTMYALPVILFSV